MIKQFITFTWFIHNLEYVYYSQRNTTNKLKLNWKRATAKTPLDHNYAQKRLSTQRTAANGFR